MVPIKVLVLLQLFMLFSCGLSIGITFKGKNNNVFAPCDTQEDCEGLKDAECISGICQCNQSVICVDQINRVVTKIGESCRYSKDCNVDHSFCSSVEKNCVCKEGMVKSIDSRKCLKISDGIGGSCEDSVQCYTKTPHSKCQEKKCACQQHTHENNGSCFRNVELGQKCEYNEECTATQFAKCIESKCDCAGDYVASGSTCLVVAHSVDSPCIHDVQCTAQLGGASFCSDGFCKCKELYQHKPAINKCVRDLLLGETCMKHSECHDPPSRISRLECVLGECKCNSFYIEENGYCISCSEISKSIFTYFAVFMTLFIAYYVSLLEWIFEF